MNTLGTFAKLLATAALTTVSAACGSSSHEAAEPAEPTTVTATATVTATVTATATTTTTVTARPQPAAKSSAPPPVTSDFDQAWLLAKSQDAIQDIRTVDERLRDGIMVSSALYLLSDSYGRMLDAGVPPGIDASTYRARLATLSQFASLAGDEYDDDPMQGTARYRVVRRQTGILFGQINSALGTELRLP